MRAGKFKDCPTGNLINRKTTKASSSAEKYARDCFTLYMFINGEKHGIENVFQKKQNKQFVYSDVRRQTYRKKSSPPNPTRTCLKIRIFLNRM